MVRRHVALTAGACLALAAMYACDAFEAGATDGGPGRGADGAPAADGGWTILFFEDFENATVDPPLDEWRAIERVKGTLTVEPVSSFGSRALISTVLAGEADAGPDSPRAFVISSPIPLPRGTTELRVELVFRISSYGKLLDASKSTRLFRLVQGDLDPSNYVSLTISPDHSVFLNVGCTSDACRAAEVPIASALTEAPHRVVLDLRYTEEGDGGLALHPLAVVDDVPSPPLPMVRGLPLTSPALYIGAFHFGRRGAVTVGYDDIRVRAR